MLLATGAELTPNVELGLRYDDGAAETGAGVELGGGLRYADPVRGLTVEATARALLAHEAGGYEEWGMGGSLQLDPGRLGRGLSLRLASGWGLTDSSTETLWQQQTASGLAQRAGTDLHRAGSEPNGPTAWTCPGPAACSPPTAVLRWPAAAAAPWPWAGASSWVNP